VEVVAINGRIILKSTLKK